MNNLKQIKLVIVVIVVILVIAVPIIYFFIKNYKERFNNEISNSKSYKGLVLFDIDGTLTVNSKEKNQEIVDYCLSKNFAVGVSTAGSIYTMKNLLSFKWMPENLYEFMKKHNDYTFNNVGSMLVNGKKDFKSFKSIYYNINLDFMRKLGYAKGFTMYKTANILGIKDNDNIILCDDSPDFINGYKIFCKDNNTNYKYINCTNGITLNKIKSLI